MQYVCFDNTLKKRFEKSQASTYLPVIKLRLGFFVGGRLQLFWSKVH